MVRDRPAELILVAQTRNELKMQMAQTDKCQSWVFQKLVNFNPGLRENLRSTEFLL